jgi:mannose-6-phosphate isomerase
MTETTCYPLLLEPCFERGDGGDGMLREYLAGTSPEPPAGTSCSWEVVDAPPRRSLVRNGPASGRTLSDLTLEWGSDLVGRRHRPGRPFPVCLRLLQSGRQEPLTVHPERPGLTGAGSNTKFWYCLNAAPEAIIISGINPAATRLGFLAQLNTRQLRQSLQVYHAERYDAFLAPVGRVHALGAGNLLIEVQEHPVEGLSVSGWGPEDAVHSAAAQTALEHVLFSDRLVRRITRDAGPIRQTRKVPLLPQCPSFHIDEVRLCDRIAGRTAGTSFHLFYVIEGRVRLLCRAEQHDIPSGRTVLLPACIGDYCIETLTPQARLLKVALPE